MVDRVASLLLDWYDLHARDLPWRARPGTAAPDPYRVWLSEVMLQQTTTAAVAPFFAKFTRIWPTVEDLAAAPEEDVMAAWAGLGYYSRARNLVAASRQVVAQGGFPDTEAELRKLPGLGAYTAAAVAAIAFGQRAVVVDANVERVVARLFAIRTPLPAARKPIAQAADRITPDERAGDFAQAMMDIGATICTSRDPKCLLCPLADCCEGRAKGIQAELPVKPPKKVKPTRKGTAFWVEREGEVLLVTRPGTGLLAGMRALPDDGWNAGGDGSHGGSGELLGVVRHTFTHFALELEVRRSQAVDAEGKWWPVDTIEQAGLPTLFAKAARLGVAAR